MDDLEQEVRALRYCLREPEARKREMAVRLNDERRYREELLNLVGQEVQAVKIQMTRFRSPTQHKVGDHYGLNHEEEQAFVDSLHGHHQDLASPGYPGS